MATEQVIIFNFKKFVLISLFCALFLLVQQLEFSWTFIQTFFVLAHDALSKSVHDTSTGVENNIFTEMTILKPLVY